MTLYQSQFANGAGDWKVDSGRWAVHAGAYRQENEAVGLSFVGDPHWSNYTLTLKARKLGGKEGFLIAFGRGDEGTYWWNIGGWANQEHGIELDRAPVGKRVRGFVESGHWYDIKIDIQSRRIRCYLDGTLIHDEMSKPVQGIFAQAGRDDKTGEIILKVVNVQPSDMPLNINIFGTNVIGGTMLELTSANPNDENSFSSPGKIEPIKSYIKVISNRLKHTFPANSLSIIRLK